MVAKVAVQVQVKELAKTVVQQAEADGAASLEAQELQVKEITVVQETEVPEDQNLVAAAEVQVVPVVLMLHRIPQAVQAVLALLRHYLVLQ